MLETYVARKRLLNLTFQSILHWLEIHADMAVASYFISILQTLLIINKLVDTISVFLYIYSIEDLPCTNPVGPANDSTYHNNHLDQHGQKPLQL